MISELANKSYLTMTSFWLWWWEVDNEQDELARTFLTVVVPTLVLLWYKWTFPNSKKVTSPDTSTFTAPGGTKQLPPGPYGLPLLGYLPFLGSNLHEKFTKMSHRYGPIFSLRLGTKLHVVVNSMELAKVVVRDEDKTLANRSPPLTAQISSYGVNNISWSNNNTHWRNMRKLLVSQVMSSANLSSTQSIRTREVRKMVAQVYEKLGQVIDINETGFSAAFDVLTSMLWGGRKSGEGNFSSYLVERFLEVEFKIIELQGARNISDFLPMLSWLDLQGRQREMKQQMVYVNEILDQLIQGRMKANSCKVDQGDVEEDQKDFLQILLELKQQKDTPTSYTFDQIKALLMNIVTAATVTISIMVEWVMAEILHNPEVQKKIVEELNEVVGMNNIVEESHLSKLSYLDAAIKETLRLHPPLPLLVHRCPDEACKVGGYTIPKGTVVYLNVWAIQRDPKNWVNPLEFKPERFLDGNKWDYNGNDFKYLPFGSGRRMCPGINLGEKMLMYTVASFLHSFEWRMPEGEELELSDEYGFLTKKRKPLLVIPSQNLSDVSLYM